MALPSSVFLTAEWRDLAMLNYVVDPALLRPLVPSGTEIDEWNGSTYVSLVGFRFLNTRVRGIAWPLHRNFEEINLRFYVRRRHRLEWRRGVVFIQEIVPRWAIAMIARVVYNENYAALPMSHLLRKRDSTIQVEYGWRFRGQWSKMSLIAQGPAGLAEENSEARFITEHYWGYCAQRDSACMEYQVEHPSWAVWTALTARVYGSATRIYGPDFARVLTEKPASAFLAEGSPVKVYNGTKA